MKYDSCLNCKERYQGCHSKCDKYKKYKEEIEKIKLNKKKSRCYYSYKRLRRYEI